MVVIHKNENERCNKEIDEICKEKYIYLLRRADGKYFYEDMSKIIAETTQDKYLIIHDHVSELFYSQVHCADAYTSSSSLAGHHNMDMDGTIIFLKGEPYYVSDKKIESLFFDCIEPWDIN